MSTETPEPSPSPTDATPYRRSWEVHSLVIATVVGLLSLGVAAYTAYTLRAQTRAQVYPYLQLIRVPQQHRVAIHNKGTGPAFIHAVTLRIDGKPVTTWKAYFAAAGFKPQGALSPSTVSEAAIAANETYPVLTFDNAADFSAYGAIDPARSDASICYCSVLDECWVLRLAADAPAAPQPVASCRVAPSEAFAE
jgi:hypothetical protein